MIIVMFGFIYIMHYNLVYHHCLISQIHDEAIYIDAHTETYIERHKTWALFSLVLELLKRALITESQNGRGRKGPLWVI